MKKRIQRVRAKQVSFGLLINICMCVCVVMALVQFGVLKDRARHKQKVQNIKDFKTSQYVERMRVRSSLKGVELALHRVKGWVND